MDDVHLMTNDGGSDHETVYMCSVDGCGRRVVVNWQRPDLVVLDRGDFFARHVSDGRALAVSVAVR